MEGDFREELKRSNSALQGTDSKLRHILIAEGHETENTYVLNWMPEQLEDIYTVLIGGSYLVHVEIDKYDSAKSPIVERVELESYLHGLSKINQIRLAVARELACTKT